MPHWLVAYGHAVRCEKADDPREAARLAYGMVDERRMTLTPIPALPRRMTRKALNLAQRKLAVRHFRRTGGVLNGFENEPKVKDAHWTQCQLCRKSIVTTPSSAGVEEMCCTECEAKLSTVPVERRDGMSIASLRTLLSIEEHTSPWCV